MRQVLRARATSASATTTTAASRISSSSSSVAAAARAHHAGGSTRRLERSSTSTSAKAVRVGSGATSRWSSRGSRGLGVVAGAGAASADPIPCVMQFVKGVDEAVVPEVKLTRSRDGSNGVATFIFMKPTIFDNDADVIAKGEITGLYMIDEEGTLTTTDVVASFMDGKPLKIEARYVMKSAFQWDRFMRFMERYANENGLGFNKA